jgi:hypothetical protein
MKKTIYSTLLLTSLLSLKLNAQFTNKLESVCATNTVIEGNGTITFPASDFAICAFTTQVFVKDQWVDVKVNDKTPQNGKYSFKYTSPVDLTFAFPLKVRTVTNRQTISEITVEKASVCVNLTNSVLYLKENESTIMKLTFKSGGIVLYEGNGAGDSGKFTWSGRSNNFTIEGLYQTKPFKVICDIGSGDCTYLFNGKTGKWKISK